MHINSLPIYTIFILIFTLIGLWALINEFLTVKVHAALVIIPICSPWHESSIRKEPVLLQLVTSSGDKGIMNIHF